MRQAKWVEKGRVFRMGEFLDEYRKRPATRHATATALTMLCERCEQRLYLRPRANPTGLNAHFAHYPDSGPCPLKDLAAKRYRHLRPVNPDPANGHRVRDAFSRAWQRHYAEVIELVDEQLSWTEFVELLQRATDAKIWEYRGLEVVHVPYLLCCLADFTPGSGLNRFPRDTWKSFWFSTEHASLESLWIHRAPGVMLVKAVFDIPSDGSRPGSKYIIDKKELALDPTFLAKPVPLSINRPALGMIKKWLATRAHDFPGYKVGAEL